MSRRRSAFEAHRLKLEWSAWCAIRLPALCKLSSLAWTAVCICISKSSSSMVLALVRERAKSSMFCLNFSVFALVCGWLFFKIFVCGSLSFFLTMLGGFVEKKCLRLSPPAEAKGAMSYAIGCSSLSTGHSRLVCKKMGQALFGPRLS